MPFLMGQYRNKESCRQQGDRTGTNLNISWWFFCCCFFRLEWGFLLSDCCSFLFVFQCFVYFFSSFGIAPKEAKGLENFNRSAEIFGQPRGVSVGGRRALGEPPFGLWGRVGLLPKQLSCTPSANMGFVKMAK